MKENKIAQSSSIITKLLWRPGTYNQHVKHSGKEIRPWKCFPLLLGCVSTRCPGPAAHTPSHQCSSGTSHVRHETEVEFRLNGLLLEVTDSSVGHGLKIRKITLNGFTSSFKSPRWYNSNASFRKWNCLKDKVKKKWKPECFSM